jgi:Amiloride-sensitive sodium channel
VEFLRNFTVQRRWLSEATLKWNDRRDQVEIFDTLTRLGIGFTFNMIREDSLLHVKTISDDFRYRCDGCSRTFNASISDQSGLEVTFLRNRYLQMESEICRQSGFIIHPQDELPSSFNYDDFSFMMFELEMEVLITPQLIETNDDLRDVSPQHRQCYFENEKKLKYFTRYSKRSCEDECRSNLTFATVGCVLFNYVRDTNMEVCSHEIWRKSYFKVPQTDCECFPSCNRISYSINVKTKKLKEQK